MAKQYQPNHVHRPIRLLQIHRKEVKKSIFQLEIHSSLNFFHFVKDLRQRVSVKPAPPPSGPPANIGQLETTNPPPPPPPSAGLNAMPGRLPRAILPPQQTFWGAILDAIVGDGPSKR